MATVTDGSTGANLPNSTDQPRSIEAVLTLNLANATAYAGANPADDIVAFAK